MDYRREFIQNTLITPLALLVSRFSAQRKNPTVDPFVATHTPCGPVPTPKSLSKIVSLLFSKGVRVARSDFGHLTPHLVEQRKLHRFSFAVPTLIIQSPPKNLLHAIASSMYIDKERLPARAEINVPEYRISLPQNMVSERTSAIEFNRLRLEFLQELTKAVNDLPNQSIKSLHSDQKQ